MKLLSVAAGMAMFCYNLNIEYPQGLRFPFKTLQEILYEFDFDKTSPKCGVHLKVNSTLHRKTVWDVMLIHAYLTCKKFFHLHLCARTV